MNPVWDSLSSNSPLAEGGIAGGAILKPELLDANTEIEFKPEVFVDLILKSIVEPILTSNPVTLGGGLVRK